MSYLADIQYIVKLLDSYGLLLALLYEHFKALKFVQNQLSTDGKKSLNFH